MLFLHDVHELNEFVIDHISLSICIIQFGNHGPFFMKFLRTLRY